MPVSKFNFRQTFRVRCELGVIIGPFSSYTAALPRVTMANWISGAPDLRRKPFAGAQHDMIARAICDSIPMNVAECPVVEKCGGCPLLSLTAAEERAIKFSMLEGIQSGLGTAAAPAKFVTGQARVGYRNRIRLRVDEVGTIGFFNSENRWVVPLFRPLCANGLQSCDNGPTRITHC